MLMKERIGKHLNNSFSDSVVETLQKKFPDVKGFESGFNLLAMACVTTWDKKVPAKKCQEIRAFLAGFEEGYMEAENVVAGFNGQR